MSQVLKATKQAEENGLLAYADTVTYISNAVCKRKGWCSIPKETVEIILSAIEVLVSHEYIQIGGEKAKQRNNHSKQLIASSKAK